MHCLLKQILLKLQSPKAVLTICGREFVCLLVTFSDSAYQAILFIQENQVLLHLTKNNFPF